MLADAIRSEAYRFSKNRMTAAWSLLFVPVVGLILGVAGQMFMKSRMDQLAESLPPGLADVAGPLDLGDSLVQAAAGLSNPALVLFVLIGAATLYAGDYRWESWRLTSARNRRPNLLLGKVVVVAGLVLLAMTLFLVATMIGELARAAIFERPLAFSFDGEAAGQFLALAGLAWLRNIQVLMISLLAAVVSRSLLAALFVPLALAIAQSLLAQTMPLLGWTPADWHAQLLAPGLSYDTLKDAIQVASDDQPVVKAGISLVLWTLWPLAAAIAWFQRQDLSKE